MTHPVTQPEPKLGGQVSHPALSPVPPGAPATQATQRPALFFLQRWLVTQEFEKQEVHQQRRRPLCKASGHDS